jgi:hypothetical protein
MHHIAIARQLTHQAQTIRTLIEHCTVEQARWKPSADDWSILEVINHLYDEERADFRQRIDYLLHKPGEEAPPIDPQGWVTTRAYNERALVPSLKNFLWSTGLCMIYCICASWSSCTMRGTSSRWEKFR